MADDIKQSILEEAGKIVNGARRAAYGKPENNFERIARFWQAYFENTGRANVKITAADVSPMMRLMKEARLCESPDHRDSFVDIIGYTLTGAEINIKEPEVKAKVLNPLGGVVYRDPLSADGKPMPIMSEGDANRYR